MQNAEHFLESMKSLNNEVFDYSDAILFAICQVPKINHDCWFGEIGGYGIYFANSKESRWYPGYTLEQVSAILAGELL